MGQSTVGLAELVRRWQGGWGRAKGLAPATAERNALRVLIGQPDRYVEVVALRADEDLDSVRELAVEVAGAAQANWLTVPTTRPEAAESVLREAGLELLDRPEWLMTTELDEGPSVPQAVSPAYTRTTTVTGPVIEVRVVAESGELAARGTMAVSGTDAVAHNIVTTPGHRRRGLASVVMTALVDQAVRLGATTGLLVASVDGQHLYTALGWTRRASVLIARRPLGTTC